MSCLASLRLPRLVALVWLGLGCSKVGVLTPAGQTDAARPGKGDAPGTVVVQLDAPLPDAEPRQGDGGCNRTVTLRGVSIARPVPFDVVIVADNSDSLSWSHESLASGLENLLGRVHGHEARFFVLTTSQYDATSRAAVSPFTGKDLVSWQDPVSGAAYLHAVTRYHQECTDGNGTPAPCPTAATADSDTWKVKGTWQFQLPPPVAAITPTMDGPAMAAEQKRIADAILGLGGGGSPQEQPICTLLRYLGQEPTRLPKHAVFVVLSDEDDTSPPAACLASYEAYRQPNPGGTKVSCDSNCPEYVYTSERSTLEDSLAFTCVPVDDKGTTHPERAIQRSLVLTTVPQCTGDAGSTAPPCIDVDLAKAATACGAGTLVQSCTHKCSQGTGFVICSLSRPDDKTDLCSQPFDEGGARYANLADYCLRTRGSGFGACKVMGLKPAAPDAGTSFAYGERAYPLVEGQSTAHMIEAFKSNADRLLGRDHHSVEAIVLDPAFDCPLHSGQSYAPSLRSLASSSNDIFPLCEDYAPAIERIASFADYLIQTESSLDLDEYEAVDAVMVTNRAGAERALPADGYRYDRAGKLLRLSPSVLTPQDESLAVNVARYCQVVIP